MSTTCKAGKYRAEVLDQGFGQSEAKGTPYFFLQLKILARLGADGRPAECPRYELTYRQYLANEVGVNILRADLRALAVDISDLTQLDPDSPNPVRLGGRQI